VTGIDDAQKISLFFYTVRRKKQHLKMEINSIVEPKPVLVRSTPKKNDKTDGTSLAKETRASFSNLFPYANNETLCDSEEDKSKKRKTSDSADEINSLRETLKKYKTDISELTKANKVLEDQCEERNNIIRKMDTESTKLISIINNRLEKLEKGSKTPETAVRSKWSFANEQQLAAASLKASWDNAKKEKAEKLLLEETSKYYRSQINYVSQENEELKKQLYRYKTATSNTVLCLNQTISYLTAAFQPAAKTDTLQSPDFIDLVKMPLSSIQLKPVATAKPGDIQQTTTKTQQKEEPENALSVNALIAK
jgi:chromosome segregation ATPase